MRLKPQELNSIKAAIHRRDPKARIYLFGSRVDDDKRGGDIDLLIMSQTLNNQHKRPIRLDLYDHLGEQKIDLIISPDTTDPFVRLALTQGIEL